MGYRKSLCLIGGITIFRRTFLVSHCPKIWWASLECFRKFGVSNSFMHNRGITIFRRKFLVSQCRKFSWASVQGFRKFGVSKSFMLNRGYHKIPSKIFCLTVPKNFVGIPSMSQKNGGVENFYAYWGVSRFSVEKFWSHSAEKFRGHHFNVSENLRYRKSLCLIGGITIFRRKFSVSQCRKLSLENPTVSEKIFGFKKFYGW